MIELILPPQVAAVEAFGDVETPLYPEETAAVVRAVAKRRQEFTTVRHCARQAMVRLGTPPAPILPGPRGAPRWPDGLVGSMTHCDGYRAAALAHRSQVATIGIDAEPHQPLPRDVLNLVASPAEQRQLAQLSREHPAVHWDRLLFAVKESVYKAWFPLTQRWLGFEEAQITFTPAAGRFTARLLVCGPTVHGQELDRFHGRFLTHAGLVVTAIVWPCRLPTAEHHAGL